MLGLQHTLSPCFSSSCVEAIGSRVEYLAVSLGTSLIDIFSRSLVNHRFLKCQFNYDVITVTGSFL